MSLNGFVTEHYKINIIHPKWFQHQFICLLCKTDLRMNSETVTSSLIHVYKTTKHLYLTTEIIIWWDIFSFLKSNAHFFYIKCFWIVFYIKWFLSFDTLFFFKNHIKVILFFLHQMILELFFGHRHNISPPDSHGDD